MKKERRKRAQNNIHTLAANTLERQNIDSETEHTDTEDETTEEDEDASEVMDVEDSGKEGHKSDAYEKDMYKALDGSALMAVGPSTDLYSEGGFDNILQVSCYRNMWRIHSHQGTVLRMLRRDLEDRNGQELSRGNCTFANVTLQK